MSRFIKKKEREEDDLSQKEKKEQEEQKMLKRMRKERKERKKMRAVGAELVRKEKEELMRWKGKEKKHGMVGMRFLNKEERARVEREKCMDHQEHEVIMLNTSIMVKLNSDQLVEEHRTSMEMF
jgi:hypothetical protein